MKNLILIFINSLFLFSCEEEPHDIVEHNIKYAFMNQSGVKVAIVPKGTYTYLPDSLVLENGETHSWGVQSALPISPIALAPIKIYFNEVNAIYYGESFDVNSRDPRESSYYISDDRKTNVYTFTVEDYQRAVEQNKK